MSVRTGRGPLAWLLRQRSRLCCADQERGSLAVGVAILFPLAVGLVFMGVQVAFHIHANTVASVAAEQGARTAAGVNGSVESGTAEAREYIAEGGGPTILSGVEVSGQRAETIATVTVTGNSLSVIPGWTWSVEQTANVPVERTTRAGQ